MTTQEWIKRNLSDENVISLGDSVDVYFYRPPKNINKVVKQAYWQGMELGRDEEKDRLKKIILGAIKEFGL